MPKEWAKCRFPVFTSRDSDSLRLKWGQEICIDNHPYISDAGGQSLAWPLGNTALHEHLNKNVLSTHWPICSGILLSQNAYHLTKFYSQNYWFPFAFAPAKSEKDLSIVDRSTWTQKNWWESSCSDQMTKLSIHTQVELENPYLAFPKVSVTSSKFWPPIKIV